MRPIYQAIVAADKCGISRHLSTGKLYAFLLDVDPGQLYRLLPFTKELLNGNEVITTTAADLGNGKRLMCVPAHEVLHAPPGDVVPAQQGIDHIKLFHGYADVAERD